MMAPTGDHRTGLAGMSNALLEAMACGVPTVATNIPAIEGLLEQERNALLVAPRAPAQLSQSLLRLLRDDQLRAELARAAARTARAYSLEDVVSKIELAYAELTGAS